jgi:Fe-S-cluster-containing dehydrogenase component
MEARREHLRIDPHRCTGCGRCLLACSMHHHGRLDPRLARIRLLRFPRPALNVPVICMACDQAPCIKACPMNARVREPNGTVVTDPELCIGCRACVYICPAGSPTIHPGSGRSMTCDMCRGNPAGPECVRACRLEGALTLPPGGSPARAAAREAAGRGRRPAAPAAAGGGPRP